MPKVLTAAATVMCVHPGTVQVTAGQSRLTVDGQAVLVLGDLDAKPVSGCALAPTTSTSPCTTTTSMTAGASTLLTVDGVPVLLDLAAGGTTSVPPGTFRVQDAGQARLEAS